LLLILFCTVNQAWFMGLFFLLAGYYTPAAYDRRGTAGFVRERLLRLGVPLAGYFFLLHPITVALAQTANGCSFVRCCNISTVMDGSNPARCGSRRHF
jgi:glucans biosynthesis protein C